MNNLLIGLAQTLIRRPDLYSDPPYLAIVHDAVSPVMAALRTPPHNLVLSTVRSGSRVPDAAEALTRDVSSVFPRLPGVLGPRGVVESFLRTWERRTGQRSSLVLTEGVYGLERVVEPPRVSGHMRPAADRDAPC